jgi:hypothetical protein
MAEPVRESYWRDALEALAGIPIFLALFIGLPLVIFLLAGQR